VENEYENLPYNTGLHWVPVHKVLKSFDGLRSEFVEVKQQDVIEI
jgi:hypothetical protein